MAKAYKSAPGGVTKRESNALYIALSFFGFATIVSFATLYPTGAGFIGGTSMGLLAALLGTGLSVLAYYIGNNSYPSAGLQWFSRVRRDITKSSLALVHGIIVFFASIVLFRLLNASFEGVWLDPYSASVVVGLVVASFSYVVYLSSIDITTIRVSTVLSTFLGMGALASMLTAPDPQWWQLHFSSLGASGTKSSFIFNLTLVLAGLVIIALSDYIAEDFSMLKASKEKPKRRRVLQGLFVALGVLLAFVGIFEYDTYVQIHNAAAGGLALVFVTLIVLLRWIMPTVPAVFVSVSYGILAGIVALYVLYQYVGAINLTTVEMSAAGIIFVWIILFIRQLAEAKNIESGAIRNWKE